MIDTYDVVVRVAGAVLLGSCIGFERQFHHKMVGVKTNSLVCLGATLYVLSALLTPGDPSAGGRIIGQVVSGMGFLGGGVILREGFSVKGLSTAATLWCTAAVGCMIGLGYVSQSIVGAAAILGVNVILRPLTQHLPRGTDDGD
jgi:putative Mg2+ transporter-C (MgtC) family protein